ncbi:uncharacterized protein LOC124362559 [Homalodisca vitripennis]|uniref:uncharacterized protein LOC124362559 n=1 Tax=Homalodisca vitripennis TaxID=197043 RepID=UPI001EEB5AF5|nr:uncharacterized protein LOC124362559 [Homalodisca vitripennis]
MTVITILTSIRSTRTQAIVPMKVESQNRSREQREKNSRWTKKNPLLSAPSTLEEKGLDELSHGKGKNLLYFAIRGTNTLTAKVKYTKERSLSRTTINVVTNVMKKLMRKRDKNFLTVIGLWEAGNYNLLI